MTELTKTTTTNDYTAAAKDVFGEIFSQAKEGAADGTAGGFAEVASRRLAVRIKKAGAPVWCVDHKFTQALLAVLAPALIMLVVSLLGDKVPQAKLVRGLASRALRAQITCHTQAITGEAIEWIAGTMGEIGEGSGSETGDADG